MGHLNVRGGSSLVKSLIIDMVPFILQEILPDRETVVAYDSLNIKVDVSNAIVKTGNVGMCECVDPLKDKPVTFDISLARQGVHRTLIILAHELVHVSQYASGDLRVTGDDTCTYMNKNYVLKSDEDYWRRKWEREAYGMQLGLTDMFLTRFNLMHSAWVDPSVY